MAIPHITPGDAGATVERFNTVIDVANDVEQRTVNAEAAAQEAAISALESATSALVAKQESTQAVTTADAASENATQARAESQQAVETANLAKAQSQVAENKAQSLVDRANAGEFDGEDGKPGKEGQPGPPGTGVSAGMVAYDFREADWTVDGTGFKLTVTNAQHKGGQTNALIVQVVQLEQGTNTTSPVFDVFSVEANGTITIKSDSRFNGRLLVGGGLLELSNEVEQRIINAEQAAVESAASASNANNALTEAKVEITEIHTTANLAKTQSQSAENKAQSVVDRANAGEFDGKDGEPGPIGPPGSVPIVQSKGTSTTEVMSQSASTKEFVNIISNTSGSVNTSLQSGVYTQIDQTGGQPALIRADVDPTAGTIAVRGVGGAMAVGNATGGTHAMNRDTADGRYATATQVATKQDALTAQQITNINAVPNKAEKTNTVTINGSAQQLGNNPSFTISTGVAQSVVDNITNNTTKIKNVSGGFAAGNGATASTGGAVGSGAKTTYGGAVGNGAESNLGFAGGSNAKATGSSSVQLGEGTNAITGSLQFLDYQLLNASGKIPKERLNDDTLTILWTGNIGHNASATLNQTLRNFKTIVFETVHLDSYGKAVVQFPVAYLIASSVYGQILTLRTTGTSNVYVLGVKINSDTSVTCIAAGNGTTDPMQRLTGVYGIK